MTVENLAQTLETLERIGASEVALPLSPGLFPPETLSALRDGFPKALRLVDGQLLLIPHPAANRILRELLQHLYLEHL